MLKKGRTIITGTINLCIVNANQGQDQHERQHEVDTVTSRRARRLPEHHRVPRRTRRLEGREDDLPGDAADEGDPE